MKSIRVRRKSIKRSDLLKAVSARAKNMNFKKYNIKKSRKRLSSGNC